jgi:hypothetical protein
VNEINAAVIDGPLMGKNMSFDPDRRVTFFAQDRVRLPTARTFGEMPVVCTSTAYVYVFDKNLRVWRLG